MADIITMQSRLPRTEQSSRQARVYKFISGKGGTGKTTIATNLAFEYAQQGRRCLLMDAVYSAGNIGALLRLDTEFNTHHVIDGKKKLEQIRYNVADNLDVILSGTAHAGCQYVLEEVRLGISAELSAMRKDYDVILIDSGSGIDDYLKDFNSVAQYVVVQDRSTMSRLNAFGAIKLLSLQHGIKEFGWVVNKSESDDDLLLYDIIDSTMHKVLKGVRLIRLGSLPDDYQVSDCEEIGGAIVEKYPSAAFSLAIKDFSKELYKLPMPKTE